MDPVRTPAAAPPTAGRAPGRGLVAPLAGLAVAVALGAALGAPLSRDPAARILHPADGAVVASPLPVVLAADGVDLVSCGVPAPCEGHLNVLVDRPCLPAGDLIPSASLRADDLGVHGLADGSTVLLLDLPPGAHTLCAQLADGARLAFGATDAVTITVDHLDVAPRRDVVATVPPLVGPAGDDRSRSDPWPAPTSAAASRTSP